MTRAYARVRLPMHLNWSAPGRVFDLGSRADRARLYEIVLQEGRPADILASVDGALLVDLWDELVLPRAVRSAWTPVVHASRNGGVKTGLLVSWLLLNVRDYRFWHANGTLVSDRGSPGTG